MSDRKLHEIGHLSLMDLLERVKGLEIHPRIAAEVIHYWQNEGPMPLDDVLSLKGVA